MRTYDDTFSGEKIYPGKVRMSSSRDDEVARTIGVPGTSRRRIGLGRRCNTDRMVCRASSTSVVIARSSDSRTARLNPSSFNARTPVALLGPSFSEDSTRRGSLRYGRFYNL
jgi:hypothetical protein